jgi:threonyl-tRNA synthetase
MINVRIRHDLILTLPNSFSNGTMIANEISAHLNDEAVLCKVNGIVRDLNSAIYPTAKRIDGRSLGAQALSRTSGTAQAEHRSNEPTNFLRSGIEEDSQVEILTLHSSDALEVLRHSAAHIMAKAVKELFPDVKIAVGPATEFGFFYDFATPRPLVPEDLVNVEARMHEIAAQNIPFERLVMKRDEATEFFRKSGEDFKVDILNTIDADEVSIYKLGELYDLCRGPHLPSTKFLNSCAFKLIKVAGAYWLGDASKAALQRISGVAFASQADLDTHFLRLEEAERRDHRKLGAELDLFHMQDIAPGAVFWHEKGWTLYRTLQDFIRGKLKKFGYCEVNTPILVDKALWEKSGHWEKFRENMFVTNTADDELLVVKPMNCPCHVQIFNKKVVSYRDLPWRIAEFGACHRYEPSGALHGLMRVRGFVQDDAHIFCRPNQIVSETKFFCQLLDEVFKELGFSHYSVKFSDRPARRAGSDEVWDLAEKALQDAALAAGLEYTLNPGEGAFYGPKLEFVLKDCLGRDWQCGTLQVDFVLPERLGAQYVTELGAKEHPVMLHRAVLGSLERFIGILIEHYAGKFPIWLAPIQVVVATITNDADAAAMLLAERLKNSGIRAGLDVRREKISYKVREHSEQKIPYIFVIGKQEIETGEVSVRKLGGDRAVSMPVEEVFGLFGGDV